MLVQPLADEDPREIGGYRLYARLGAGGMGRVYLSYTPGGRAVALKVVRSELAEDEEFRRRFAQEVASARLIHGLYTAQVVDSGPDWLATAYVPGPSLGQVVRGHGPLPERTVVLLIGGIAEALQVIHAANVVHRDLKPANVLVSADGPRVIDFGIARAADADMLTATGVRIGSPAFMAPEQALDLPVTPATDVWALGALAAYVASGVPPFGEGPHTTVLYRVVHEEPQLDQVPEALRELVLRCLAKRPEDRPTPAEVIAAASSHSAVGGRLRFAEDWLPQQVQAEISRRAALPEPATADPAALTARIPAPAPTARLTMPLPRQEEPAARPRKRKKLITGLAVAVVLAAGGGAAYLFNQADQAHTSTDSAAPDESWTSVYGQAELTTPDSGYDFDLTSGKVVPQQTTNWAIGRTDTEFRWSVDSDAFAAPDGNLTPADCNEGIDSHPVTTLKFGDLPAGSTFCVRSRTTRDIAIAKVKSGTPDGGEVTLVLEYFRHSG